MIDDAAMPRRPPRTRSATPTTPTDIAAFRRFTRMYTRYIGTLNEGIHRSAYPLPEARVIYELATRTAPRAKSIAADLGMDAGYLSRMLRKFEHTGLLKRKTAAHDARSTELALTGKGAAVFARLNSGSELQAQGILQALPPAAQKQLIDSMRTIEDILMNTGQSHPPFILRPHRVGDMGWIVHREGLGYAQQFGWDATFEALVARITADFLSNFDSARERCWIAEVRGQNAGHIFLVKHPERPYTARLRLLFVEPSARGLGLGAALVNECVQFARTVGYRRITLWTQSSLSAAHHLYKKAGFRLIKEEPHKSFGQDLVGQEWELNFSS
jgi:DNA-binding MarR family transcriptional regulator/GNAT superfamily N-acetyltransferase